MSIVILIVFLSAVSGSQQLSNRIVGGEDADIDKYPFIVSMQFDWYESAWRVACGGTIITVKTILSAAHCYEYRNTPFNWRVRVGSSYPSTGGQLHTVKSFFLHKDFHKRTWLDNDVAIVRLNAPVTLSPSVKTARIAGHNYHLADDTLVTTMGWGRISFGGENPDKLQEVDIYIINQQLCRERYESLRGVSGYEHYPEVTSSMICAGILDLGGKDSCTGDSGGPVIHDNNVVIGITSWAYGCADPWYPGVKTRVSEFVNWIAANGSW